ncbi:DUF1192 family protein [Rhodospirillum rubrum]|uniref:DUF1192 family protein n=1 Tax=Rhodospirillum rubrum TaxID=1085 RepID=UPI00003C2CC4|nr:DUF1192 family protein [Rhodospirillum rubrum]AEO47559.1 hypothetical protein F11_05445 [Rhodospirillum rubrum F11]MBK1665022.1 DUF1192 domain-containing protein [Rhodospirillum rubrum]MBK1676571.1 DUF1192 domain-containing protein [Rhodospirillum rubrum]MBK5953421.1 DUF1192 domain-containing protein [Rhodospirillum rubrum]QXG81518.1 DUF1192 domain-containing protein [Rhodospirillum rubrum]
MDTDDLDPRAKPVKPVSLDDMTVKDLEDYISALEAEIARARAQIAAKGGAFNAAASVFKR